ncbi:MAG: AraC family transcriptional regulator [Bacilli bacterium]|nr:AraC family transcriptional regulator [Bacilli bacterium]
MSENIYKPSMGVLNLRGGEKQFQLTRHVPSEEIGFFVKHFWIVSWDLSGQQPYLQDVVPNPCVNLVIEKNRTGIYGIAKNNKFSYLLQGKGRVFGVKFKPGGFYPFVKCPVSSLTNQPMSVRDVFDVEDNTIEHAILSQEDEEMMVRIAESFIQPKLPARDETILLINEIIDQIRDNREIMKVDDICQLFDFNKRKLQRMFDLHVGATPKWVIMLYRLQNAAEIMDNGQHFDWVKLSTDLGYFDQSHFIKDFKAIIGKTPEEYARQVNRTT